MRSEAARRRKLYASARKRWRVENPDRKYELDQTAVYVAPVELRPILGEEKDRGAGK
jgi:hypothetical protein